MKYFEGGFFIQLYIEAGSKTVRLTNENAFYTSVQSLKDDFIKIQEIKLEFFLLLFFSMAALDILSFLIFIVRIGLRKSKWFQRPRKTLEIVIYNSPF